jgi:SAM-dependent methyltransferase
MLAFLRNHVKRISRSHLGARFLLRIAQRGVWFLLDAGETLLGRRDPLTPPRRLMNVGSDQFTRSDFNAIGRGLFERLVDPGGLKPNDHALEVGCGVGRMAIPLTRYLTAEGTYDGFDIVADSIDHCTKVYAPRFSNFHFHHADIFNSSYNPDGKQLPHQYRFPFPDKSFSFVFLTSVFTHMLSEGVEHYLREIERVLLPGGRCFITYFILNPESEELMMGPKGGNLKFVFPVDQGKSIDQDRPEEAVAFHEPYLRELYRKCGLQILEPLRYGSWCGRTTDFGYQDTIVGVKGG